MLKPCRDPMDPEAVVGDGIRRVRKNNRAESVMIEDTRIEEEDVVGYLVEVFWYEVT